MRKLAAGTSSLKGSWDNQGGEANVYLKNEVDKHRTRGQQNSWQAVPLQDLWNGMSPVPQKQNVKLYSRDQADLE